MQANETVYEFGSSPDEDDENPGGSSSTTPSKNTKKKSSSLLYQQANDPPPTGIAGTNLRSNKTSSTSINQKLNTSFSSISDNHPSSHHHHPPNPRSNTSTTANQQQQQNYQQQHHHQSAGGGLHDISASDEQLLLKEAKQNAQIGGSANLIGAGSISNTSNTSISSATNSSRGNVSQSGNQSISASSQKSLGGHGGHQPSSSSQQQHHHQNNPNFDSNVISERVKNLATQIYQELKRIISRCNYDEDILSGLMPLIVRVLESLDLALIENQQLQVELELCKDDNEQLVIMFEKEKAAKRAIDKKLIESEYSYEEERQQYQQKIESLDNQVKMFELKTKNASDQAARFEEKEAERKREYNKLHDRYTELLKSHCDVVERVRHLVGNAEAANLANVTTSQHQMGGSSSELGMTDLQTAQHLAAKARSKHDDLEFAEKLTASVNKAKDALRSWNAETELTLEDASLVVIDDMLESNNKQQQTTGIEVSSHNESDRTASEQGEGEHEKESENDSIAYTSMEKEFRKLIQENKDLLNTKNALNVVKDDLIAEVDRLTNEVSMYEQAVEQLNSAKDQMKHKVSALDAELRKTKEDLEKAKQKIRENNEEGVPYSQRKRFGRAEMAKVLMERNNYKERFMELQDAVRYTELVRANKVETEKRSGLWKFFSNLFGAPPMQAIGPGGQSMLSTPRQLSPVVSYQGSPATVGGAIALTSGGGGNIDAQPGVGSTGMGGSMIASDALQSATGGRNGSILSTNQRLTSNSDMIVLMDSDLNIDRSRALSGHLSSSDSSGYIHAYGWSLPASSVKSLTSLLPGSGSPESKVSSILGQSDSPVVSRNNSYNKLSGLQVPIPQYCRPLTGDSLGMKIWCATAIDLSGGDLPTERPSVSVASQTLNTTVTRTGAEVSSTSTMHDSDTSGSIVNISTSTPIKSNTSQQVLKQLEQEVSQALGRDPDTSDLGITRPILKTTTEMVLNALPFTDDTEELSTCVWICSTQHSRSKITIIDIKTKPNELLDSFYVPTFLYCIKSIPGTKASDPLGITSSHARSPIDDQQQQPPVQKTSITLALIEELISSQRSSFYKLIQVDLEAENKLRKNRLSQKLDKQSEEDSAQLEKSIEHDTTTAEASKSKPNEDDEEISRILDNNVSVGIATLQKLNDFVAHIQPQAEETAATEETTEPGLQSEVSMESKKIPIDDCKDAIYYQPISTHLSTVWMGGRDAVLYVHSAIGQWKDCLACVKLPDSILQICHYRGRVFVALADGSLCVFFRNVDTKQWEFSQYLLIDINLMSEVTSDSVDLHEATVVDFQSKLTINEETQHSASTSKQGSDEQKSKSRTKVAGIRCLEIANRNLWVGYKNRVLIIEPISLKLKHTFNVVPQMDNQIRQLIAMRDGVFCCLRSDLILRLYSSLRPYQHIQNIDIEPVVTRLISPKTFVISHITAMKVADNTLWIGNAHGIILTIPCKLVPQISEAPMVNRAGEYEESPGNLSIARFVPKCDITNAQISFHGHRDAVKFFINAHKLMLSGGQGYLDFRLDMDDQSKSISDKSHLILWQLPS